MLKVLVHVLLASWLSAQTEIQKIEAPVPHNGRGFGQSVAVEGGWLVVGAPEAWSGGFGKLYVYRENRGLWELYQVLFPEAQRRGCFVNRVPSSMDACFELDLGFSVAISGDRILAGAPSGYRGSFTDREGQAFLYRYDPLTARWEEEVELSLLASPSPVLGDLFGWSVALDGDVAVVGAPERGSTTGCAYIFERTTSGWAQTQVVAGDSPGPDHYFGESVAVDGERIAIGEYREGDAGYRAGAVYVLRRTFAGPWVTEAKILPESQFVHSPVSNYFGYSVDIEAGILVIGAVFFGASSPAISQDNPGAAYVYRIDYSGGAPAWVFQKALSASDGARENEFGGKVAISGNRIVVCAAQWDRDELADDNSGSAYVYGWTGSDWIEESILRPGDAHDFQYFGNSVACEGDLVVIGASHDDVDAVPLSGSVYLFSVIP